MFINQEAPFSEEQKKQIEDSFSEAQQKQIAALIASRLNPDRTQEIYTDLLQERGETIATEVRKLTFEAIGLPLNPDVDVDAIDLTFPNEGRVPDGVSQSSEGGGNDDHRLPEPPNAAVVNVTSCSPFTNFFTNCLRPFF